MPIQNTGTAMPNCASAEITVPAQERRARAATYPSAIARIREIPKAARVSGSVTAMRDAIWSFTLKPEVNEVPGSPRSSDEAHSPNWLHHGRSEPTWRRAASICSGVAVPDKSAFAGSPGRRRRRTKIATRAADPVRISSPVRRSRYRVISS